MKKLFLVIIFLTTQPAYAKSGLVAFDEYLKAEGVPIHGVSGTGANARIDFKPGASKEQENFANAARATFDWSDKPDSDPAVFRKATYNDADIPIEHIPIIQALSDSTLTDAERKALWSKADIKDVTAKDKIEQAAQAASLVIK